MKFNWNHFKNKLINSRNEIQIFEKPESANSPIYGDTAMETIVNNVSSIIVNNYLRILGTGGSLYENIFDFKKEFKEVFKEDKYIIAHDVFGGLFASEKTIHYFSPDNLQWENLELNYEEFIYWIADEDICGFYEPFLWNGAEELISKTKIDEGVFIYPFLWAKECNVNTAFKKIVPFRDLLEINAQNKPLLADETSNGDF